MLNHDFPTLLSRITRDFRGFNPPARPSSFARLANFYGPLPSEVILLYKSHDGSRLAPTCGDREMHMRLMPIDEVLDFELDMKGGLSGCNALGRIAWLWTNDSSDYAGVAIDGPAVGTVVQLQHDGPDPVPAYRSVGSFYAHALDAAESDDGPCDFTGMEPELPTLMPTPLHTDADRRLVRYFEERAANATDHDAQSLLLRIAITWTPFEDTSSLERFFDVDDLYVPTTAIELMQHRKVYPPIATLERLATERMLSGAARGAMNCLAEMRTPESILAIDRLKTSLSPERSHYLESALHYATLRRR